MTSPAGSAMVWPGLAATASTRPRERSKDRLPQPVTLSTSRPTADQYSCSLSISTEL